MRLAISLALLASCSLPPHAVLTIEDPGGAAAGATHLLAGFDADHLAPVDLDGALAFPLQITVAVPAGGEQPIVVEAREDVVPLARGSATVRFRRTGAPSAVVVLAGVCEKDDDCADELFCDGTGFCRDGLCAYEDQPCVSDFSCVTMTCNETARVRRHGQPRGLPFGQLLRPRRRLRGRPAVHAGKPGRGLPGWLRLQR